MEWVKRVGVEDIFGGMGGKEWGWRTYLVEWVERSGVGGQVWWNGWEGVGVEDIFGGMGEKEWGWRRGTGLVKWMGRSGVGGHIWWNGWKGVGVEEGKGNLWWNRWKSVGMEEEDSFRGMGGKEWGWRRGGELWYHG